MTIREITPTDHPLLGDFIYNAIYVPLGEESPPREIIYNSDVFIYINCFGNKPGDYGVVAELEGKIISMAWTRIIPAYGHIDNDTPELATSVLPEYRGQGVGTMLMNRLFELLHENGYKQTSLAVQKKNDAVRFYGRLGYKTIRENDKEEYICS